MVWTTSRLGHVAVAWDNASGQGGPISCRGTTVTERRLGDPVGRVPVLRLQPGMDCALSIRLVNRGSGTVDLDTVVQPYMGPEDGAEVQVANLADLPRATAQSEDGSTRPSSWTALSTKARATASPFTSPTVTTGAPPAPYGSGTSLVCRSLPSQSQHRGQPENPRIPGNRPRIRLQGFQLSQRPSR